MRINVYVIAPQQARVKDAVRPEKSHFLLTQQIVLRTLVSHKFLKFKLSEVYFITHHQQMYTKLI